MSRPAICFQRSCRIMRLGRESFWNLPCFLGSETFFLDSRLPYYKFFVTEIKDTTRKKSISVLNDSVYMYTLSFVFLCFMHYPVLICLLESRSRAVFLGGQSHQPGGIRRSSMPWVEVLIMKAQLRWTGHVMRMEDSRLPK